LGYRIYDENNVLVSFLENDSEVSAYLETIPEDIYTFPVEGLTEDVELFMLRLNSRVNGNSFFDSLKEKYGRVPLNINPFEEVKDLIFGNNAFFVKIRRNFMDMGLLGQLLAVLRKTLSAGSTFFLIMEPDTVEETYDMSSISETGIAFYVPGIEEVGPIPSEEEIHSIVV